MDPNLDLLIWQVSSTAGQRRDTEYHHDVKHLGVLSHLPFAGHLPGCWRPRARRGEAQGDYGGENAVIWADDVRRDASAANGQLMMPLRQTKEANPFEILVIGYLEITLYIYVYIFRGGGRAERNIRKEESSQRSSGCKRHVGKVWAWGKAQRRCLRCVEIC